MRYNRNVKTSDLLPLNGILTDYHRQGGENDLCIERRTCNKYI